MVQGMSIACSTPEALKWDPEWAGTHEISGRAMKNVHTAGDEFSVKRCALLSTSALLSDEWITTVCRAWRRSCRRPAKHDGVYRAPQDVEGQGKKPVNR